MNFFVGKAASLGIEVMWETPGTRLIANEVGEVIGIYARSQGRDMAIKAAKGVVLTCGTFAFNESMIRAYMPCYPMGFEGNPANTGDGIRMALDVGGDLWHMTAQGGGGMLMKFPGLPMPVRPSFGTGSYMIVGKTGKRFIAESKLTTSTARLWAQLVYDTVKYTWPQIPAYYVFDKKRKDAGRIVSTFVGPTGSFGMYKWTADNSDEVARGWIVSADTIGELAAKMNLDPATLEQEVAKFNGYATTGNDADFGRTATTMKPLDTPPYYAVVLWPHCRTAGGPRRNGKAQVVDAYGEPIPRLYVAGELGVPQSQAYIGECVAFGRIAGEGVAALEAWG
jgi:succinate dehydrogenase/fumarate reductase flavoprotein subunit